jgi:hypothetical protein
MSEEIRILVNGHLDGTLTQAQEAELNAWLLARPENAAEFAKAVRFHDHLHNVIQTLTATNEPKLEVPARLSTRSGRRFRWLGGIAAVAALIVCAIWLSETRQANAATELDLIIEKTPITGDRTYRIRSLDPNPAPTEPRQPPIDGALLSIRPPEQYVLIRHFPDGRPYVTGSDGERNWDIPPWAPVRVSRDPLRFRWPLPGHQHGVPFADLRSDLVQLRVAYDLSHLETDDNGWRGLQAIKKSPEHRGPKRVELWYDPSSGIIHRMVFHGLPKARGGPDSVAVELVEQRDLGESYFQHPSHHAADRRVIEED